MYINGFLSLLIHVQLSVLLALFKAVIGSISISPVILISYGAATGIALISFLVSSMEELLNRHEGKAALSLQIQNYCSRVSQMGRWLTLL